MENILPFLNILNKYWNIYSSAERDILCGIVKESIKLNKIDLKNNEHIKNIVSKSLLKHNDFQMLDLCSFLDPDCKWDKLFELFEQESSGDIPPIPEEERIQLEKLAIMKFTQNKAAKKKSVEEKMPVYKVNQLVTATDHSGMKWVARVLDVYTDAQNCLSWYYVHYENMDDIHNEWLSPPYRITKYNPMIARYYEL